MTTSHSSTHTISLLVANKPGVLFRVAGLFSRRGWNIESLAVGPTERPEYSRMTVVVQLHKPIEQMIRQVQKLLPVVKAVELQPRKLVERELMLVKISTPEASHMELSALLEVYNARIVDVSMGSMLIEATGSNERLDALELQLKKFRIQELCRTGRIALESGSQTIISAES